MVAKLDHTEFSVTSVIKTPYPIMACGNGFIAYGTLYLTNTKDTTVIYAFDLVREKSLDTNVELRPANGTLAMLSYYPGKHVLYMWDNMNVKICHINFTSDQKESNFTTTKVLKLNLE